MIEQWMHDEISYETLAAALEYKELRRFVVALRSGLVDGHKNMDVVYTLYWFPLGQEVQRTEPSEQFFNILGGSGV